jgi:hypothetical protein
VGRTSPLAICDVYRSDGVWPAIQKFVALTGLGEPEREHAMFPEVEEANARRMARMQQNVEFFLARYLLPVTTYVPDVAALRASSRVIVGVGEDSAGQLAHKTALAMADRLETAAVTFPGDHSGFFTHPESFAERLADVFRAR